MARVPSFQRKGPSSPSLVVAIGKPKGGDMQGDGADDGPEESGADEVHDEKDIAVCPNCGCTFNDETGKIIPESHPQHPVNGSPANGGTPSAPAGNDESGDMSSAGGGY